MIKEYNYSNIITNRQQNDVIKLVDKLIASGDWCKNIPSFQTHGSLFIYEELKIFKDTFLQSCSNYANIPFNSSWNLRIWCYRDNRFNNNKKDQEDQWHCHSGNQMGKIIISGIYYLRNLRNEGTEFKGFNIKPKPYTWFLYPPDVVHRPPKIKSIRNRYTLGADLLY